MPVRLVGLPQRRSQKIITSIEHAFSEKDEKWTHPRNGDSRPVQEGVLSRLSLHAALGQEAQLRCLLQQPCRTPNVVDADGDRTPLHWAAARGHLRCLQSLLEAGAYHTALDSNGRNALVLAYENKQIQCVRLLEAYLTFDSVTLVKWARPGSVSKFVSIEAPSLGLDHDGVTSRGTISPASSLPSTYRTANTPPPSAGESSRV